MEVIIQVAVGSTVRILSPAHLVTIWFASEDFAGCTPSQDRRQFRLDTGIPCFTKIVNQEC